MFAAAGKLDESTMRTSPFCVDFCGRICNMQKSNAVALKRPLRAAALRSSSSGSGTLVWKM
jgi:hypothetical protein